MPPPFESPLPAGPPEGVLADLPLLDGLPAPVRELVAAAFTAVEYAFGDEIVRQGDEPDGFYVLASGRARAVRHDAGGEVALGSLSAGDTFGETGLLEGTARTATVRASSPVRALRLEPGLFRAIAARHPEVRDRLQAQARARRIPAAAQQPSGVFGPPIRRLGRTGRPGP
jgi:CRP-like cAMP-binding protein